MNSTPVTDGADFTVTAGVRYYGFYTVPSTYVLYDVVGIEWKNGGTVAGNIICGVDAVDADPPTLNGTPLIALSTEVAQAGTSAVQRNSNISSCPIRAGSVVGIWVSCSSSSAKLREQTGLGSQNQQKATSYSNTPDASEITAWSTATARKYLKIYLRGYS